MGIKHEDVKASQDKGYASEWNKNHIIDGDVDYNQYSNTDFVIENRTDFPAGPVDGQVIFRTDLNGFYVWNGTAWKTWGNIATILVAADGSGDYTDIQSGINALPATGGIVYIKEGSYNIIAQIDLNIANITLMGAGRATIIQDTVNVTILSATAANSADNCIIQDLKIIGVGGAGQYGIYLETDNCIVKNCWIQDVARGIYSDGGENNIIDGNYMTNCQSGVFFAAGESGLFTSNVMDSCGEGISIVTTPKCIAKGNICKNGDFGIVTSSEYNSVVGNICIDNTNDGIQMQLDTDNNVISSNVCTGNGGIGIWIRNGCLNNVVMSNHCTGNTGGSITDSGTNTLPNGATGTTNLQLDDLNYI